MFRPCVATHPLWCRLATCPENNVIFAALVALTAAIVNVYGTMLAEKNKLQSLIEIERERGRLQSKLEEKRASEEMRGSYNRLRGPLLQ
eukprot:1193400-Prorocentrum_minimum.AAC.1